MRNPIFPINKRNCGNEKEVGGVEAVAGFLKF
jgi:hypothetical protein